MTSMLRKSELPQELLSVIFDQLSAPDLCSCACVSLLFNELAYEERRWVSKLQAIGVWSDDAARQYHEEEIFRRQEKINGKKTLRSRNSPRGSSPRKGSKAECTPDIGSPSSARSKRQSQQLTYTSKRSDLWEQSQDSNLLNVLQDAQSIRGQARQEFGKIWVALAPFYEDIARATNPSDPVLFRRFRSPEDQAAMLRQLLAFSKARASRDWRIKNAKLADMVELFEGAALREFEIAYDSRDEMSMRRYADVLDILNDGQACVETFCRKNVLFTNPIASPFECFDSFSDETAVNLAPMGTMMTQLTSEILSQRQLIARTFHESHEAWGTFIARVFSVLLTDYINKLTDYARQQSTQAYLLALTGSYQHLYNLVGAISESTNETAPNGHTEIVNGVLNKHDDVQKPDKELTQLVQGIFEEHVSYYLEEEIALLRENVVREVTTWDKQMRNESLQTEQLFLSAVNRETAKKNFLQSFTKVILMPVNVVGSVMPFPGRPAATTDETQPAAIIAGNNQITDGTKSDLPTTELAARAAIMNSGLARIKRLLSLEVALHLIHACKESIERARLFIGFTGRMGEETREQCEAIFSIMLQALGTKHVQVGFEMALESLKAFNPRRNHDVAEVQPLVDFLELVHVGDLMQQMVDVFYNQELTGIVDKTDFLSPAVKEKKKFEQMIDERVAEGLNRGIDVLIEQIDYLLVTTQKPTDFKPWLVLGKDDHLDLSASETAVAVVQCLSTHTDLLRGSTDKGTLDVFYQEVGVRFFGSLCKHFKRQTITVEGGLKLISDLNYYHAFITSLKQPSVTPYFVALKELGNIYIISGHDGKAVGQVISDIARFGGVLRPEDVYEFAERRADWPKVKKHVDRVIYGTRITEDCSIM